MRPVAMLRTAIHEHAVRERLATGPNKSLTVSTEVGTMNKATRWIGSMGFVALAAFLGMVPITPGGLGFVEAGLVGTLSLAGIGTDQALLATLIYRLAAYWLPIPTGAVAYLLAARKYGRPLHESADAGADSGADAGGERRPAT